MRRGAPILGLVAVLAAACELAVPGSASPPSGSPSVASIAPSVSAAPEVPWPGAASNPGATWDPTSGLTLIFGGDTPGGAGNELWGWDGAEWQLLDDGTGTAPRVRDDAQLVADPVRRVVVLHGGRTDGAAGRVVHSDTWEWDGSAWAQRVADGSASAPPPRLHPVSGWDRASQRVILAGGVMAVGETDVTDTWAWDGATWEQIGDSFPDANAIPSRMAYDASSDSLTILAIDLGHQTPAGTYVTDLWLWDGVAWAPYASDGPDVSPVQPIASTRSGLLLFDGGTLQGISSTWSWDGVAWTRHEVTGPAPRNGQSLVYDEARDRVVLFSGSNDAGWLDDVWEWTGSAWREAVH